MRRVAIITGASSGIGAATAKEFYEQDYCLVLNARSKDSLAAVANDFEQERVELVIGDICEEETAKKLVSAATERFSGIHVVVNNAGVGVFNPVEQVTKDEFEQQLHTNVLGPFFVVKHALQVLREQDSGQIIMVGSMAGKNVVPGGSAYCASKWALLGFTGSLKHELRDTHIKVASILPGSVDTPFFDKAGASLNEERYLSVETVAHEIVQVAHQHEDADIDEVVLRPAKR